MLDRRSGVGELDLAQGDTHALEADMHIHGTKEVLGRAHQVQEESERVC